MVETEPADKLYWAGFTMVTDGIATERRQDCVTTYRCDGTCYGFYRDWFGKHRCFVDPRYTDMQVIPPEESAKLDTPFDWQMAELRLLEAQRLQREKMVAEEPSAPR